MNDRLKDHLDMFLLLKTFFQNNSAHYTTNASLIQSVATLNETIEEIVVLDGKAITDNSGYAEDKADRKQELIAIIVSCYMHLKPWFYENPDNSAPMETRITLSEIRYANDARLLLIANKTYEYVQTNIAGLSAYHLHAGTQTALQTAIAAFETLSDVPYRLRDNRKKAYKELHATIKKCSQLVREEITRLMATYYVSNPSFYKAFTIRAKLGKTPTQTMALRVKVKNAEGMPISHCQISVQPSGNHKAVNKITQKSGQVHFQNLANGFCTITAIFPDGETQQQEIEIMQSKRADAVLVMKG